jgi:hypothetical protein
MITKHFSDFGEFVCRLDKYHVTRHQLTQGDLIHLSHENHTIDIISTGLSISICRKNINGVAMYVRKIVKKNRRKKPFNNRLSLLHFNQDEITLAPTGFPMLRFGFANERSNVYVVFNEVHDEPVFTLDNHFEHSGEAPLNTDNAIPEVWSTDNPQELYQGTITIINKLTRMEICDLRSIVSAKSIQHAVMKLKEVAINKTLYNSLITVDIRSVSTIQYSDFVK